MAFEVESLRLWQILKDKDNNDQRSVVRALVDEASAILDRVIETFPTDGREPLSGPLRLHP